MGSVVISVDAELDWGFHDLSDPPRDRIDNAKEGWRQLLELLDTYQIPATWAVVGHLLLECYDWDSSDNSKPGDVLDFRQQSSVLGQDLIIDSDLVTDLLDTHVDHDVGCHTYSHIVFEKDWITEEIVKADLAAACETGRRWDLEFDSFVFPRNAVGYRHLLADFGFITYRGKPPRRASGKSRFTKMRNMLDPDRVALVEPYIDEFGLVNIPPSMYLFAFEGTTRRVIERLWTDPIVYQATHGIDQALSEDGIFHMWLHPNNIVTGRDFNRIKTILEHIERRRQQGLEVKTMADVARPLTGVP